MSAKHHVKNTVQLTAYDHAGQAVLEQQMPLRQYGERSHPLLDDASYRKARGIVRLSGVITDHSGAQSQEFEVRFDAAGRCIADAARFADGTVLGNWDQLRGCDSPGAAA